jgi:RNA polymerase sigma-70 factor (ECF subfamily)
MGSSSPEPPAVPDPLIVELEQARSRFLQLVDDIRPDLHRYAARMTGSVADGEDVVQDTLARAYYQLAELREIPPLRPWLFRIAHNRAIDHWRHEAHRRTEPIEAALEVAADAADEPDLLLARQQAVRAALSAFLQLAPAQRGSVILKDVLDHSLEDIASELELSVPAVKAALHRGRALLRQLADAAPATPPARSISPQLLRYASLFNAHDWDGVRALLADDVRLDLVSRHKAAGRRAVGIYFSNYERLGDWRLLPAWLEGREILAVVGPGETAAAAPRYFVELQWEGEQVKLIRDFRHVRYIAREAAIELPH